ncbi:hypothetical protein VA7868_00220 [Vibrio aerogenes CECT 7868]|uniref:Uncharacterized protein n=1 Tax=Vibrio aerogenes CECT 7868 TaxID=1216006 RepID=A0A1M5UYW4_9VIBR|nr:hypothetical protein [Vibrio aerogenes]SHH68159.1 hypothetical protein VA7868_00220 [Vibrio aerogenes CECT 7868]
MTETDEESSLQYLNHLRDQFKVLSEISVYQKKITRNYQDMFWGVEPFQELINLCPKFLQQTINPWSFSLISLTKEMKGKADLEADIVQEVASYGSQLGTVIDFLELIAEKENISGDSFAGDSQDKAVFDKFESLVKEIQEAKIRKSET